MWDVPNMFRTIRPEELHMPPEANTNAAVMDVVRNIIQPNSSIAVEMFMICDAAQCLATTWMCMCVLVKKGRMRSIRLFTLKKSPYGTFIVPNAICILLVGTCIYLLTWAGYCGYIVYIQKTDRPLVDWVWFVPYPWLPLVVAVFYSTYGFILTCSPRSPISNLAGSGSSKGPEPSARLSRLHLPLPHSALVMNTFMISVGVGFVAYNTVVQFLNVGNRNRTHSPGHDFYVQVLKQPHTHAWLSQSPTPDFVAFAKIAWADKLNVFRFCDLGLGAAMVLMLFMFVMLVLYAVPNQIFLIRHLCGMFPDPIPEDCQEDRLGSHLRLLWRIGWPRNLRGEQYSAFKKTWMMTMVGHMQAMMLILGVALFSVPPIYLYFVPWANGFAGRSADKEITFSLVYTICAAFITAGWITSLSAMLTFDDVFKAASGLDISHMYASAHRSTIERRSSGVSPTSTLVSHPSTRDKFGGSQLVITPPWPSVASFQRRSATLLPSPISPLSPDSSSSAGWSPTWPRGRSRGEKAGLLRSKPSLVFSSVSSADPEKGELGHEDKAQNSNKVLVVEHTTITIERALPDLPSPDLEPSTLYPHLSLSHTTSAQYGFLSRNAKREFE